MTSPIRYRSLYTQPRKIAACGVLSRTQAEHSHKRFKKEESRCTPARNEIRKSTSSSEQTSFAARPRDANSGHNHKTILKGTMPMGMSKQEIQELATVLAPMISNQINQSACNAVSDMLESA